MTNLRVCIPRIAPTLNRWQRMHFRDRKKEKMIWMQYFMLTINRPKKPIEKCSISIDRYACGILPDWDNVYASAKPVLDALVNCKVIVDDSPNHVLTLDVIPHRCSRADQRTVIIISGIEYD